MKQTVKKFFIVNILTPIAAFFAVYYIFCVIIGYFIMYHKYTAGFLLSLCANLLISLALFKNKVILYISMVSACCCVYYYFYSIMHKVVTCGAHVEYNQRIFNYVLMPIPAFFVIVIIIRVVKKFIIKK